jgi:hypothetical protein
VQDAAANADRYCWLMLFDSVGRVSDKSKVAGAAARARAGPALDGAPPPLPRPALGL